jgi:hypothetical protein
VVVGVIGADFGSLSAALVVSLTTLALAGIGLRRKANEEYVARLEKRVADSEAEITGLKTRMRECEQARKDLTDRNFELLERLFRKNEGGTP